MATAVRLCVQRDELVALECCWKDAQSRVLTDERVHKESVAAACDWRKCR